MAIRPTYRRRIAALAAAVALLGLAGCSSIPDALNPVEWYEGATSTVGGWFSDDDEDTSSTDGDNAYPNLATVPDRPTPSTTEAERKDLTSGLIADRANARYAEDPKRPSPSQPAAQGDAASSATAASAAVTSAAVASAAAPSVAAPSAAVASPPPAVAQAPSDGRRSSLWPNRPIPDGGSARNVTSAKVGDHPPRSPEPKVRAEAVQRPAPPPPPPASTAQVAAAPPPPAPATTRFDSANQGAAATPAPSDQSGSVITDGPSLAQYERNLSGEVYLAGTVYFNHSSAALTGAERQMIAEIARAALDSNAMVKVVGHASARTAEMNLADHEFANFSISLSRSEAVARALVDGGLPVERIMIEALSDNQPLYYESMPSGEAGNRRAEILLLY
ncbi:MAG: OmpA family protein [Alphaproteobacteria bacterium]|nr:OmpA family protein [Alphaproteobacteria bacterium]